MTADQTPEEELLSHVGTLMRVMLVSERTGAEHQHAVRYNALDFQTLGSLRMQGGRRLSDLADAMGVAITTAASVVARLSRRGLIEKRPHPTDGRAVALFLSAEGEALANTIHEQDLANMALFLEPLGDGDRKTLLKLLGRIADRVTALETPATQGETPTD